MDERLEGLGEFTALETVQNFPEEIRLGSFPHNFEDTASSSLPLPLADEHIEEQANAENAEENELFGITGIGRNIVPPPPPPPLPLQPAAEPRMSSPVTFVFPEDTSTPKSRRPHYSQLLHTVFVKDQQDCAFTIALGDHAELPDYVKVWAAYVTSEDRHRRVGRCKEHFEASGYDKISSGNYHFLLSCDSNAIYCQEEDNQLPVYVPFLSGGQNEGGRTFTFRFMCRQTCCTPLKQRPIKIVFVLVGQGGMELGELSVGLKVSTCPFRDKNIAEGKKRSEDGKMDLNQSRKRKKKSLSPPTSAEAEGEASFRGNDSPISPVSVFGAVRDKVEDYRFCIELAEFVKRQHPDVIEEFISFRRHVVSEVETD